MTLAVAASCFVISLTPAIVFCGRYVFIDALRTILFVLGAFFTLLSLLIPSLLVLPFSHHELSLLLMTITSACAQELMRAVNFLLLKKAQHGLHLMAVKGVEKRPKRPCDTMDSQFPGQLRRGRLEQRLIFHDLHNSRHMIALSTGLGSGVAMSLLLTTNYFIALSGDGFQGLPAVFAKEQINERQVHNPLQPLVFAFKATFVVLNNAFWTIMVFDSCHKFDTLKTWWANFTIAMFSHSFINITCNHYIDQNQYVGLGIMVFWSIICALRVFKIFKGTPLSFVDFFSYWFMDWITCRPITKIIYAPKRTSRAATGVEEREMDDGQRAPSQQSGRVAAL